MNSTIDIFSLVRIGQPLILLQTWEPNRAIVELTQQLEEKAKATNRKTIVFEWRIAVGLFPFNALAQEIGLPCKPLTQEQKEAAKQYGEKVEQKPETFQEPSQLTEMFIFLKSLEAEEQLRQIIVFYRLDAFENAKEHFWNNPIVIDHLKHNAELIGSFGSVVFLYHDQFVPQALTKDIMVTEFKLPSKEERAKILQLQKTNLETQTNIKIEIDNEPLLVDRLAGMGKLEAENALRLAWQKTNNHAVFDVNTLVEIKSKIISQVPGLSIYEGEESVDNLIGFEGAKQYCRKLIQKVKSSNVQPGLIKGAILFGGAGVGKTFFAKALGSAENWITLSCNFSAMFGQYVGQSETNVRRLQYTIEELSPCIVMIDEIDKAFAGLNGEGDSGVTKRVVGQMLTWFNDRKNDAFFIVTANQVTALLNSIPELFRAGRFNKFFYCPFPNRKEKDKLWELYIKKYELNEKQKLPNDNKFSGAEIRACCEDAYLLDISLAEAAKSQSVIYDIARPQIEAMEEWAESKCLSSRTGLRFSRTDNELDIEDLSTQRKFAGE